MTKELSYDDVALIPRYFSGTSRSCLDTTARLNKSTLFKLPVVPSNMKCVINEEIAETLQGSGYFYIMHRFGVDNYEFVLNANKNKWSNVSISVGVQEEDYAILNKISSSNLSVDYITIDIAHGHCSAMKSMIEFIKERFGDSGTTLIAGNIGTPDAACDLCSWGADVLKVGIGPGKSCITKLKTGFYTPMFSAIQYIRHSVPAPIIADGGICHNGDIAKAIVAGADFVMAGSIFAQCTDSPGQTIGGKKAYFGSASAHNKQTKKNIEGKLVLLNCSDLTYLEKLKEIEEDLQSAISYAGGEKIADLKATHYITV